MSNYDRLLEGGVIDAAQDLSDEERDQIESLDSDDVDALIAAHQKLAQASGGQTRLGVIPTRLGIVPGNGE